jgi:hypothetical protein
MLCKNVSLLYQSLIWWVCTALRAQLTRNAPAPKVMNVVVNHQPKVINVVFIMHLYYGHHYDTKPLQHSSCKNKNDNTAVHLISILVSPQSPGGDDLCIGASHKISPLHSQQNWKHGS